MSQESASANRKPTQWSRSVLLWTILFVGIGVTVGRLYRALAGPFYQGRSVRTWFHEYASSTNQGRLGSPAAQAFRSMGGDAAPFLVSTLEIGASPYAHFHNRAQRNLPRISALFLPSPQDQKPARKAAQELLRAVAEAERWHRELGQTLDSPSVTNVLPGLALLLQSAQSDHAAYSLMGFGSLAAPLTSNLIAKAEVSTGPARIPFLSALGTIGPAASNAVPLLTRIVREASGEEQTRAITALGHIGPAAGAAAPLLATLLATEPTIAQGADFWLVVRRPATARALGKIGLTPDNAVAPLKRMTQSTNRWEQDAAVVALWNRDRWNPDLQAPVRKAIAEPTGSSLIWDLMVLGTNAAVFEPDIRALLARTNDGLWSNLVLRTILSPSP